MPSITRLIIKRRQRRARHKQQAAAQLFWGVVGGLALIGGVIVPLVIVVGSVVVTVLDAQAALPEPQDTLTTQAGQGFTQIYDASGRELLFALRDPLGDSRPWLALDALPAAVPAAALAWEDPEFLTRPGTDLLGLSEDLWTNWLSSTPGDPVPTLTGRLVRSVILGQRPGARITHDDRALEYALVAEIESRYSREEILEWYLNTAFYGNEAYGIEAAAQVYLGKSALDLSVDEAALLTAITTAPALNPVDDETAARGRQGEVLRRLLAEGVITQAAFQSLVNVNTPIQADAGQTPDLARDFAIFAREQAEQILDGLGYDGPGLVARGQLRIITTLDLDLYQQVECVTQVQFARLRGAPDPAVDCPAAAFLPEAPESPLIVPPDQAAVVVIDPQTGELLTMNGATTEALYQPGPTLYPFVYLHGFRSSDPNYTPASMLLDIPTLLPGAAEGLIYVPSNPDGRYYGPVSLRDAMGGSLITPATRVANSLNLNDVLRETARPLGVRSLSSTFYSLELLGRGGTVSALEISRAYEVFAGLGRISGLPNPDDSLLRQPIAVRRIEDADGNVLWRYDEAEQAANRVPVLDTPLAYMVNHILADPTTRWPTLSRDNVLETERPTAVVNGITTDRIDNWAVGYTPQRLVTVHVGRADRGVTSLDGYAEPGAAAVWRALIDYTHARDALPAQDWPRPDSMVEVEVCEISGMSPTDACPTRPEIFLLPSYIPPLDTYYEMIEINTQTRQRASINTPRELRVSQAFFMPPDEALDWWRANNLPLPPDDYDTLSRPDMLSSTVILQPTNYAVVGGVVDIRGDVDEENLDYWQLIYGQGANPTAWLELSEPQTAFTPGTSLAQWDTVGLEPGTYVLQLLVVRDDGTPDSGFVQVTVDNIPPSIVLSAGEGEGPIRWPEQSTVEIVADVRDNNRVLRVDFYRNGQYVATDSDFPFSYPHSITRTGTETFTAVVYDAVENSSEASIQVEIVRSNG